MKITEAQLRQLIREVYKEIEDEVDEATATGNVDGYQTPHAFSTDDEPDDDYVDRLNRSTGYKRVDEASAPKKWKKMQKEDEQEYKNRWLELKNSDQTPNQKIGIGVRKIRKELAEMEKFVNWYSRIRQMNELGKDDYWKRTQKHLTKIKERLVGFARKIQELEAPLDELNENNVRSVAIRKAIKEEIEADTEYEKLVKRVMDMLDIKSPNELSDDQKAKFFSYLDMLWDKEEGSLRDEPSQVEVDKIVGEASTINEKKYRVHVVTKDGEKFKSKVFPNKKKAQDYHWKLAKKNKFKSVDVLPESVDSIKEEDADRERDARAMGYRSAAEADADNWGRPKKK